MRVADETFLALYVDTMANMHLDAIVSDDDEVPIPDVDRQIKWAKSLGTCGGPASGCTGVYVVWIETAYQPARGLEMSFPCRAHVREGARA